MCKHRIFLGVLAILVLLLTPFLIRGTAAAVTTLDWSICDTCPESPEVSISGDTIVLGIADRPEDSEQNRTIHGASASLPAASEYTISFDYELFTWDSYNPTTAGWTGYWDAFSVSVSDRPYWELPLSDPVTPNDISGLGFVWGGTLWADGVLEHVSGTKTFTAQGNPSGTNYLNVILDTLTEPESNHLFPSWGTVTITEVRIDAETTLPNQAVNLAKAVVGGEYLWGGKGWDFVNRVLVEPQQVFQGYTYWNPKAKSTDFGRGLDCSGLVLWPYNKAFGATSMLGGPIKYEGADGQYRYNTAPVTESDLAPGDLLFFDWQQDGRMDHVAMYVGETGGNDVIHASQPGVGIVWDNKNALKQLSGFVGFKRVQFTDPAFIAKTQSPINLVVTDPDGFSISTDAIVESEREILVEIPGELYYSMDKNLDDVVIAPVLKPGTYSIQVEPKPGASPTDTYSLEVEGASKLVTLAQDVPISNIPEDGYTIISTEDEIVPGPPPTTTATLGKSVSPGIVTVSDTVTYTITLENAGTSNAIGVTITDTLPTGFSYQPGSTTGATTADPSITGQKLTWSGPFAILAGDTLILNFRATASTTPDTYLNNVSASGINLPLIQTGDTAPVTVQEAPTPTPVPPTPTPRPVARAVGGYGESLSALELLTPWLALVTVVAGGCLGVVLFRRRAV